MWVNSQIPVDNQSECCCHPDRDQMGESWQLGIDTIEVDLIEHVHDLDL